MQALVIGEIGDAEREGMRFAASRAGLSLAFYGRFAPPAEISALMCILTTADQCAEVASWVRDQPRHFATPVIALVTYASHAGYREAYSQGADDIVERGDLGGLTRRLANLSERPLGARPPANQGLAVVGFPDIPRRRILGRTLRQAGFEVVYAQDARELLRAVQDQPPPTLLVLHPDFPPCGAEPALTAARAVLERPDLPVLLLCAHGGAHAGVQELSDSEQAGRLLFFAEEALRGHGKNLRASHRLLHHALCSFREAGSMAPVYGLTHNVSRQGLYVRTLDPPRPGSVVWLELRAPGADSTLVHLRGTVMWRREPRVMGGAAPPGFGMRIEAEVCPAQDLRVYEQGYDQLLQRTLTTSIGPTAAA